VPVYSYRCRKCDVTRDVTHDITVDKLILCDVGHGMVRVFSAVPTIFKGSGFYKTDKG